MDLHFGRISKQLTWFIHTEFMTQTRLKHTRVHDPRGQEWTDED